MISIEKREISIFFTEIPERLSQVEISNWCRYKALQLINEKYNCIYTFEDIKYTQFGKPYINNKMGINFGISHSGQGIAIACSLKNIGIDLEKRHDMNLDKMAKRYFTNNEYSKYINSLEKEQKFLEIWTKKEAYIKWDGKGISYGLKKIDVFDEKVKDKFISQKIGEYILSVFLEE